MKLGDNYKITQKNEHVFYIDENTFNINVVSSELEKYCLENSFPKARICFHQNDSDPIQKMIIFNSKDLKPPLHLHKSKGENLILLKGSCIHREYNNYDIEQKKQNPKVEKEIFLKPMEVINIKSNVWHNLEIISDIIFIEFSIGPFTSESTTFQEV